LRQPYRPLLLALSASVADSDAAGLILAALARLERVRALPVIRPLIGSTAAGERYYAVRALEATELPQVLPPLLSMLEDPSLRLRSAAASALVSLTSQSPTDNGLFWSGTDPKEHVLFRSNWLQTHHESPVHPLSECDGRR
jgi:HEAT repeat protein